MQRITGLGFEVAGPSRILVLGPDSSLGPMIAATILPLAGADDDPKRAIALATMLALMVAAIMIVAAVAKLGFITDHTPYFRRCLAQTYWSRCSLSC